MCRRSRRTGSRGCTADLVGVSVLRQADRAAGTKSPLLCLSLNAGPFPKPDPRSRQQRSLCPPPTGGGGPHNLRNRRRLLLLEVQTPSRLVGSALKKMEDRKGIIVRFVIGRSSNHGDSLERAIDSENKQTNDFIILENHIEALEELPKKIKNFFAQASEKWDAEFFAKVNDDVYVNIDALGSTLAAHLDKPRAYIGCMKSGEVFSEQSHKWYEPDWWKFGNKKS